MKNTLTIKREYWPEVTDTPHFIVKLIYEGCKFVYDDIYFNDVTGLINRLETLERDRKGAVSLDGGYRFNAIIEATSTGSMQFKFATESSNEFPGNLRLKGYFSVSGEDVSLFLKSLVELFKNGSEFVI